MKFGAVLPTNEIGNDTGAVKAWAQAAEALGYDRIIAYDHVLGATHAHREPPLNGPYTEHDPFREPMVLFGYLAGTTSSVELMTGVLVLPQRQTALVAKQATEIDLLSGGRFVLGVGSGWNWVEYESLNENFGTRGRRLGEQVELIRRFWSEPLVDASMPHHRIDRAGILPLPDREIPIWFGGSSDAALKRAASLGDGFYFVASGTRTLENLDKLRGHLAERGRSPDSFPVAGQVAAVAGPEVCVKEATRWRDLGGSHIFVSTMRAPWLTVPTTSCATVDEHIDLMGSTLRALRTV